LRIALVQPKVTWAGGTEIFLSSVMTRLGRDNNVAIFTFSFDPQALPERDGFEVHLVDSRPDSGSRFGTYFQYRRYFKLLADLKTWRPDVVILQQSGAIMIASWLQSHLGVPVIPYVHSVHTLRVIKSASPRKYHSSLNPARRAYSKLAFNGFYESKELGEAKLVACVSKFVQAEASALWKGVDTRVIYNGVDHSLFFPTWEDDGYALCVSRLDSGKNIDLLLDYFKGAPYRVVICGNRNRPSDAKGNAGRDEYLDHILATAKQPVELMLDQGRDTIVRLIQRSSIVLQPGPDEGFGLVYLEAMACGKPVLAHASGGALEVVNGAGLLLGDDGAEWRRRADELMVSLDRRKENGKKALDYSLRFSWDRTSAQISEICSDAMARYRMAP
jgi:glycosyltransferase involved in cell wall biosynthesis